MSAAVTSLSRAEWLERRRHGIAATDIAAIAGISPWKTALDVYLEKRGLVSDLGSTPAQEWGTIQEASLFTWYERRYGVSLENPGLVVHPTEPWIVATPDRVWPGGALIVEGKTSRVSTGWGEGEEDIPPYYLLQCQWQILAIGALWVDVVVSIGGAPPVVYRIARNKELLQIILDIGRRFWLATQRGEPPPIDCHHPRALELAQALHPPERTDAIPGDAEMGDLAREIETIRGEMELLKREERVAKTRLLERMGSYASATLPGGGSVTRKVVHRKAYEVAASSYETLKIKLGV